MSKPSQGSTWFTFPRRKPEAKVRLFCFPYAGGSSYIFRNWPAGLPPSIEICTAQLPGRGARIREEAFKNIKPMVEALAAEILPFLTKPFAFFGHSMGAMISFELARQLRRKRNLVPFHLFVSGRRAPQLPNNVHITYNLPEDQFITELRRLNGTPDEVLDHPELMELVIPLLRSDFSVVETYEYIPEPPLACPITVFGGIEDKDVPRSDLEAWREQTLKEFLLHMLPGDHFFLNGNAQLLKLLADKIQHS